LNNYKLGITAVRRYIMKRNRIENTSKKMETIEKSLYDLCVDFMKYLEQLMNSGKILKEEYEIYSQLKQEFIQQKRQIPMK
jgi:hypothetical protein